VQIYTKGGDDGTTGLFLGGRASKADDVLEACGDIDEAVSVLGVARSLADDALGGEILLLQRDLFVAAADLATNPRHRDRLEPGTSRVTGDMVRRLEHLIDDEVARRPLRPVFIVPGSSPVSAALDHARTVVRRAERRVVRLRDEDGTVSQEVLSYLNRLSDLIFVLARATAEGDEPPSHD